MRRVILESPFAGNMWRRFFNRRYARVCLLDSLKRGEAPLASHLLYTQVLDDVVLAHRALGIGAGLAWLGQAEAMVVYVDRGVSKGMRAAMDAARAVGLPIEERRCGI